MLYLLLGASLAIGYTLAATFIFLWHKERKYAAKLNSELSTLSDKHHAMIGELDEVSQKSLLHNNRDQLTGLAHHQLFQERLQYALNQANRQKSIFAVLTIDIDDLTKINKLGHDVGDKVLKEFSQRVQMSIRQVDTVSRAMGGCFVVLLPYLTRPETAIYVAQRIQDSLLDVFKIDAYELSVKASIGVAIYPVDGLDSKTLLQSAETALKQAKDSGKNRYQFYQKSIHELGKRELSLSTLIRSDELFEHITIKHKPYFSHKENSVEYIQASKHLHHPELGLVPFVTLNDLVDNSGKMLEIKSWFLNKVIEQFHEWHNNGFKPALLGMKVTFKQLENPSYIHALVEAKNKSNGKFNLVVELTDEIVQQSPMLIEQIFSRLNAEGIKVALDVIALGHLSIQKVNSIPIDFLILDKNTSNSIVDNSGKNEIIRNIIQLAKEEGIVVVAEGADDKIRKDLLEEIGCDLLHGKVYGYLMPSGAILEEEK